MESDRRGIATSAMGRSMLGTGADGRAPLAPGSRRDARASGPPGSVKRNTRAAALAASTQMRPPWRSTILRQIARPMPVPSYASRSCRRWNISKTRSRWRGSMPMPSSATRDSCHSPASRARPTPTRGRPLAGGTSARWRSGSAAAARAGRRSPSTAGSAPTSTSRAASATAAASERSDVGHHARRSRPASRRSPRRRARVREQVLDQRAHPLRALDRVVDELVRVRRRACPW